MLRLAAFLCAVAAVLHSARADEFAALYQASWAGIPAGEIRLALRDDPAAYRDEIAIRSEGLPGLLTRFRASAVSEGQFAGALPAPIRYDAAYDLRKLRCKSLVERIPQSRRYRVRRPGIRTLAGLLILREKVLKPVLAGVCRPKPGRPPKNVHPLDVHYQHLQCEMLATLQTLKLAA